MSNPQAGAQPRHTPAPSKSQSSLPLTLVRLDRTGRIVWLSSDLLGMDRAQLLGVALTSLLREEDQGVLAQLFDGRVLAQRSVRVSARAQTGERIRILLREASSPNPDVAFFCAISEPSDHDQTLRRPRVVYAEHRTVLVAEDEKTLRTLTRHLLNLVGYRVVTVATGDDLLEAAANDADIGLVVLDLSMPGPSFEHLHRRLTELEPTPKILITTGYPLEKVKNRLGTDHSWAFLQKPFSNKELLGAVADLLPLPD